MVTELSRIDANKDIPLATKFESDFYDKGHGQGNMINEPVVI